MGAKYTIDVGCEELTDELLRDGHTLRAHGKSGVDQIIDATGRDGGRTPAIEALLDNDEQEIIEAGDLTSTAVASFDNDGLSTRVDHELLPTMVKLVENDRLRLPDHVVIVESNAENLEQVIEDAAVGLVLLAVDVSKL